MKLKTSKEHKQIYIALWVATYILLFPFVILNLLYELLEVILKYVSNIRCKLVYKIMEILFERNEK